MEEGSESARPLRGGFIAEDYSRFVDGGPPPDVFALTAAITLAAHGFLRLQIPFLQ